MKTKIKKWHIALMSFVLLFVAIFASLFSLRADTVDEETGEILMDNWELDLVFYDSTVNQGKTALTQINWDASNGSYTAGDMRVITIQINYKNTQAVTTYGPGELEIGIPNLIYTNSDIDGTSSDAQWTASAVVGANDNTHTGYDWDFASGTSPSRSQKYYYFTNVETIEEKSNFEGSIQIQYTITPSSEYSEFTDQCIHSYIKTLKAHIGKAGERITSKTELIGQETTITSPNWPNNYNANMSTSTHYWEYTSPTAEKLVIYFDPSSITESGYDFIYVYNKAGSLIKSYSGTSMAGNYCYVPGNYVKIAMSSDSSAQRKGFSATIGSGTLVTEIIPENLIFSNEITMNYTRTYIHPWQLRPYTINKTATPVPSIDGLPTGDYYWVKYNFTISGSSSSSYPYIGSRNHEIRDAFPAECVVLSENLTLMEPVNNLYTITQGPWNSSSIIRSIFVGYPKSIYNDENNNYNITNHVDLYSKYENSEEYVKTSESDVSLNLLDFEFEYNGDLYGINKQFKGATSSYYNSYVYYESLIGQDTNIGNGGKGNAYLKPTAIFTGNPMDVKFGDDLLYISGNNGDYRRLLDGEYYFSRILFPSGLKNGNNVAITAGKYNCELWVRYAGEDNYTLYEEFTNGNGGDTSSYDANGSGSWTLTKDDAVVAYYFIIKGLTESLASSSESYSVININNVKNIPDSGRIYNFAFIQVYINGVLQNQPGLDSYANMITQEEIATFDQSVYGTYMQRHFGYITYSKYVLETKANHIDVQKDMNWIQNAAQEQFEVETQLSLIGSWDYSFYPTHVLTNYKHLFKDEYFIKGWEIYDILPAGFELTSTKEEIINSLTSSMVDSGYNGDRYSIKAYDRNLNKISVANFKELIKSNTEITIIENYKDSGRTYLYIKIDLSESPVLIDHCAGYGGSNKYISFKFKSKITYDSFLEFGSTYQNYVYATFHGNDLHTPMFYPNNYAQNTVTDSGYYEGIAQDINNDGRTTDRFMFSSNQFAITSVISTHQDVTKYVKTDLSGYSTGTVDVSNDAEYEYKLRVRSGSANVTNLVIYDVLESAQPDRTRWTGEFLDVDTSYAENKVYKLYKPDDPNADSNGYVSYNVKVNTYTSEDPNAGNLYNEDGTFNTKYSEYIAESTYVQGLEVKFNEQCKSETSYDYVEIYYILDGTTYRLNRWAGNSLAGQTVQIPSNDFYLYWRTDNSNSSFYGFSIDSITHKEVDAPTTAIKYSLPINITIDEIDGDNYPDSNWDGAHPHGNYGNNVNKIWHYTYTGEKQTIIQGTDKSKVKSIAFEYVNEDGTPAILPANNLTYVLIQMKSPADENITTLARNDCRTQWNALDDYDRPVDFITGINSNVVKVALPNSVDEDSVSSITLRFTKEINGIVPEFENMKLSRADTQTFMIKLTSLTANEDGSYHQVTALLKSNQELIISQIPVGTYLLEELGDNYFDFVEFADNNDPEIVINGVTFERTDEGYIITVSEDLMENVEFNIQVINEIEPERFYEDKDNKENLFLKNKIEEDT